MHPQSRSTTARRSAPPRWVLRGLLLSAATLLLGLLAVEGALRLRGYDPIGAGRERSPRGLYVRPAQDPRMRYELTPLVVDSRPTGELRINQDGFRDREFPRTRPPGTQRIVALGDSITFGDGLPLGATWPKLLEELLDSRAAPTEVLNLGVTGYDTLQMVAFLEGTGLAFGPDQIVIGFCINDVGTASIFLSQIERQQRHESPIYRSRLAQWLRFARDRQLLRRGHHDLNQEDRFLARNRHEIEDLSGDAALLARLREIEESIQRADKPLASHVPVGWYASPAHVGKLRFAFRALAELLEPAPIPVLVVILPYLQEPPFRRAHDLAYALIADEARAFGFDALDLSTAVRLAGPEDLLLGEEDYIHYNALGQELIAREVAAHLAGSEFAHSPEFAQRFASGER